MFHIRGLGDIAITGVKSNLVVFVLTETFAEEADVMIKRTIIINVTWQFSNMRIQQIISKLLTNDWQLLTNYSIRSITITHYFPFVNISFSEEKKNKYCQKSIITNWKVSCGSVIPSGGWLTKSLRIIKRLQRRKVKLMIWQSLFARRSYNIKINVPVLSI